MNFLDKIKSFWNSFKRKDEHELWKIYICLLLLFVILNLIYAIVKG